MTLYLIRTLQPGGFLRQDVPAGLAPITTSNQHARQESPMVEPTSRPMPTPAAEVIACRGLCWVIDEGGHDGTDGPHLDTETEAYALALDWGDEGGPDPEPMSVRCLPDPCWTATCRTCGQHLVNDWMVTHHRSKADAVAAAQVGTCPQDCGRPAEVISMSGAGSSGLDVFALDVLGLGDAA